MSAFTDPVDAPIQRIAPPLTQPPGLLDELIAAWSERSQALGDGPISTEMVKDMIAQDVDLGEASPYYHMQEWIVNNCTSFVDMAYPVEGSTETDMPYFIEDIAHLFTLAGQRWPALFPNGTPSSFRRVTTGGDPPDGRQWAADGLMQANDVLGAWVIQDLQACFSLLAVTCRYDAAIAEGRDGAPALQTDSVCETAVAEAVSTWSIANTGGGGNYIYRIYARVRYINAYYGYGAIEERRYGKASVSGIAVHRPHIAKMYGRLTRTIEGVIGATFWTELTGENGEWLMLAEFDNGMVSARTMPDYVNTNEDAPLTQDGAPACPVTDDSRGSEICVVEPNSPYHKEFCMLLFWDFAFSNA